MNGAKILQSSALLLTLAMLAAFGLEKQDMADPVSTSALPQPDWLYLLFFQVTRYFQGNMEMIGVFWLPAALLSALAFLPLLRRGIGARFKWGLIPLSLAVMLVLGIFTFHSASTTPIWSCAACHKEGFGEAFASPPRTIGAFSKRYDNKWLALHYRYPQYFWMMDAEVPKW